MKRIFFLSFVLSAGAQLFGAAQDELNAAQTVKGLRYLKTLVSKSVTSDIQARNDFNKDIDNAIDLFSSGNMQTGRDALKNIQYNQDVPQFVQYELLHAYPEKYHPYYANYVLEQFSEGKNPFKRSF